MPDPNSPTLFPPRFAPGDLFHFNARTHPILASRREEILDSLPVGTLFRYFRGSRSMSVRLEPHVQGRQRRLREVDPPIGVAPRFVYGNARGSSLMIRNIPLVPEYPPRMSRVTRTLCVSCGMPHDITPNHPVDGYQIIQCGPDYSPRVHPFDSAICCRCAADLQRRNQLVRSDEPPVWCISLDHTLELVNLYISETNIVRIVPSVWRWAYPEYLLLSSTDHPHSFIRRRRAPLPRPSDSSHLGWHDDNPPWRAGIPNTVGALGVELEIAARSMPSKNKIVREARALGLLAERDGSLHDRNGIEIIGPPLPLLNYLQPDSQWSAFLELAKGYALGWDAGRIFPGTAHGVAGYGMHVSINRQSIPDDAQLAMLCLVNNNIRTFNCFGGRPYQRYCTFPYKNPTIPLRHQLMEKYEALALRTEWRMECRIFRSTLRSVSFLKNIEVCDAVLQFCCETTSHNPCDFIAWLDRPYSRGRYPHIHEWLDENPKRRPLLLTSASDDATAPPDAEIVRTEGDLTEFGRQAIISLPSSYCDPPDDPPFVLPDGDNSHDYDDPLDDADIDDDIDDDRP